MKKIYPLFSLLFLTFCPFVHGQISSCTENLSISANAYTAPTSLGVYQTMIPCQTGKLRTATFLVDAGTYAIKVYRGNSVAVENLLGTSPNAVVTSKTNATVNFDNLGIYLYSDSVYSFQVTGTGFVYRSVSQFIDYYTRGSLNGGGGKQDIAIQFVVSGLVNQPDLSPINGESNFSPIETISLQFTQAMKPGTGEVILLNLDASEKNDSISVNDLIYEGNTVSFPKKTLDTATNYGIKIQPGTLVTNAESVGFIGTNQSTWNFTTSSSPYAILMYSPGDITNEVVFSLDIKFSEQVVGFDLEDIQVTNGSASNLQGSGENYTVDISPDSRGLVTINLPEEAYTDIQNNSNLPSNTLKIYFDNEPPNIELSTADTETSTFPIKVNIAFNEYVSPLEKSSLVLGNAVVRRLIKTDAKNYVAEIDPISEGAVTISIPAEVLADTASNLNNASNQIEINYLLNLTDQSLVYYPLNNSTQDIKGRQNLIRAGGLFENNRFGVSNSAFSISTDGRLTVGSFTNSSSGNEGISISLWFKPSVAFNSGTVQGVIYEHANKQLMTYQNGLVRFAVRNKSGLDDVYSFSADFNQDEWYHLVVSLYAGDSIRFYVNGEISSTQKGSANVFTTKLNTSTNDEFVIGVSRFNTQRFKGTIDDFYLFGRPLSIAEIQYLYEIENGPKQIAEFELYHLKEDSLGVSIDLSTYFKSPDGRTLQYTVMADSGLIASESIQNASIYNVTTATNYNGSARLFVEVTDDSGVILYDTVDFTVSSVNDAPIFSFTNQLNLKFGTQSVSFLPSVNVVPADEVNQSVTYTYTTEIDFVEVSVDQSTGEITLTAKADIPNQQFLGTITLIANDGQSENALHEEMINVRHESTIVANYLFTENNEDNSFNSKPITLSGTAFVNDRYGNINRAIEMDGLDDYMLLPANNHAIDFQPNDEFTISFWVKSTQQNGTQTIFNSRGFDSTLDLIQLVLDESESDSIRLFVRETLPELETPIVSKKAFFEREVYNQVVITRDENATYKFYINGELAQEFSYPNPGRVLRLENSIAFGARLNSSTVVNQNYFKGFLDDINIESRALSAEMVSENYAIEPAIINEGLHEIEVCLNEDLLNPFVVIGLEGGVRKWFKDGIEIQTTSNTVVKENISLQDSGQYVFTVENGGLVISDTLKVFVNQLPNPQISRAGTVLSVDDNYVSYVWSLNGVVISGADSTSVAPLGSGRVKVIVTDENGCENSAETLFSNQTIYVDINALGNNSGVSWAHAFPDIRSALASATEGAHIWVANGTYKASNTANPNEKLTLKKGVNLYGGFSGNESSFEERDSKTNVTILSGDLGNNDTGPVSSGNQTMQENTRKLFEAVGNTFNVPVEINGFTIKGMYDDQTTTGTILWADDISTTVTIRNCIIEGNYSGIDLIGGLKREIVSSQNATPSGLIEIKESIIRYNLALRSIAGAQSAYSWLRSFGIEVVNSLVHNNSIPGITNNPFNAMFFSYGAYQAFKANESVSYLSVINSTIVNNTLGASVPVFRASDNTFAPLFNQISNNIKTYTYNTIIYGNGPNQIFAANSGHASVGNIQSNNLLVDPEFETNGENDFYLSPCSPAIDAGNNSVIDLIKNARDLNGNIRKVNANVDLGAFEYQNDDPDFLTTPPVVVAQDIIVYLDASGIAQLTYNQLENGTTDNCSPFQQLVFSISESSFDCQNIGVNEVILSATDEDGNIGSAISQVTVVDEIAPMAAAKNITISLPESGMFILTSEMIENGSTDNCGISSYSIDRSELSSEDIGENLIILTVADSSGNQSTDTATVTVIGYNAPPQIVQTLESLELNEDDGTVALISDISSYFSDPENDSLTFGVESNNENVKITMEGTSIFISLTKDFFGESVLTISASDLTNTVSFEVLVTVLPVNDAPQINFNTESLTVGIDEAFALMLPQQGQFTDLDGDVLTYSVELTTITALTNDWLQVSTNLEGTEVQLTGTPTSDDAGILRVTLFVSDGQATIQDIFDINVFEISEGLYLYYPFSGNAQNALSNSNNGIINGAVSTDGHDLSPRSSYAFDGNASIDFGDIDLNSESFSLSFWIKPSENIQTGVSYRLISQREQCKMGNFFDIAFSTSEANGYSVGMEMYGGSSAIAGHVAVTQIQNPFAWNHVIFIKDNDSRSTKAYLNGNLVNTSTWNFNGDLTLQTSGPFGIAISPCIDNNSVRRFEGNVDEIRLIKRAIAEDEILELATKEDLEVAPVLVNKTTGVSLMAGINDLNLFIPTSVFFDANGDQLTLETTLVSEEGVSTDWIQVSTNNEGVTLSGSTSLSEVGLFKAIISATDNLSSSETDTIYIRVVAPVSKNADFLYYPFDGSATNQVSDEFSGTISGAVSATGFDNSYRGSLDFSQQNSAVDFGNIQLAEESFSVGFWIKLPIITEGVDYTILSYREACNANGFFEISYANEQALNGYNVKFSTIDSNLDLEFLRLTIPNPHQWNHIAFSKDSENRETRAYLNGELKDSKVWAIAESTISVSNNGSFGISTSPCIGQGDSSYQPFNGTIDELRVVKLAVGLKDARRMANIAHTNNAPEVQTPIENIIVNEKQPLLLNIPSSVFKDVDGDDLTLSIRTDSEWIIFNETENEISGTPSKEDIGEHLVTIEATDGVLFVEETFVITVVDVNDLPTDILISNDRISENLTTPLVVGRFSSLDDDAHDTHSYSIFASNGATDNQSFSVEGDSLILHETLDFEAKNFYVVGIQSTDLGGLSFDKLFTIFVDDSNEAPEDIVVSSKSILENNEIGQVIATFTTQDPDAQETFTYQFSNTFPDAVDNELFDLSSDALVLNVKADFENKKSYSIAIKSTDKGGLSVEKLLIFEVLDGNDAPVDITLSGNTVEEHMPSAQTVGELTTQDEDSNEQFTYSMANTSGSTDHSFFDISGNSLIFTGEADFENKESYTVSISSTDKGGLFITRQFTIVVIDGVDPLAVHPDVEINVYPNPVYEVLKILSQESILRLTVITLEGKILKETNKSELYLGDLANGSYLLQIHTESKIITRVITKQ